KNQLDFEKEEQVGTARIYWFDDAASEGGCRVPKSFVIKQQPKKNMSIKQQVQSGRPPSHLVLQQGGREMKAERLK
ncbi:MAG: hypothetical protein ACEQSK_20190, partial [Sphingomonadaceae bacterium]